MEKLKNILSEVFEDVRKVDKHKVIEGVRNYGIVGKQLYNNNNIMEIAKQLAEVAESAHNHILGEQDDWFDKISVNKNMKQLKGGVMEFTKTAKEAHSVNQRLTALYEDIGHILNRYYEISEDKGDMDNDGKDEPDSEEYLDNKDKAIKKAMKDESLNHDENVADSPDSPDREGNEMEEGEFSAAKGRDKPSAVLHRDRRSAAKTDLIRAKAERERAAAEREREASESLEMKEIKRSLADVGGVVNIPALGDILKRK